MLFILFYLVSKLLKTIRSCYFCTGPLHSASQVQFNYPSSIPKYHITIPFPYSVKLFNFDHTNYFFLINFLWSIKYKEKNI